MRPSGLVPFLLGFTLGIWTATAALVFIVWDKF